MHELSIVSGMLKQIEKILQEQNWKVIYSVKLEMGVLSGVERQSIETCFELLTQEWQVKPKLIINIDPIEFLCENCHLTSRLENIDLKCSYCGHAEGKLQGGRKLYFSEMEGE